MAKSKLDIKTDYIEDSPPTKTRWRTLIAWFILGLCNNFGFSVMLTAAHDILDLQGKNSTIALKLEHNMTVRDCNQLSTGTILLADTIPGLFIKMVLPFLPFIVNLRIGTTVFLSASGFLMVAFSTELWMAIFGVILTSFASGIGEATLLSYTSLYDKNVLAMLSSGNGAAGLLGAFTTSAMTSIGISPVTTLLIMTSIPITLGLTFWLLLPDPDSKTDSSNPKAVENNDRSAISTISGSCELRSDESSTNKDSQRKKLKLNEAIKAMLGSLKQRIVIVPKLLKYVIPLGSVYFCQYFINQGLTELVEFDIVWLSHSSQYRWLQVAYRIGTFLSQSAVRFIQINQLWVLLFLQMLNVALFTTEVLRYFIPSIWIVFALSFWEGLIGGSTYVNTYNRISKEVASSDRLFSLSAASFFDSMGTTIAGFVAMPVHNALCLLPKPNRHAYITT